ncbi:MAG: hypothetical protein ACK4MD_02885 [Demequina sp.]
MAARGITTVVPEEPALGELHDLIYYSMALHVEAALKFALAD